MRKGILLAQLIREQDGAPTAPPPIPQQPAVQSPAVAAQPAQNAPTSQPADALVQKDFNAFKAELKGIEDQKSSVITKWEQAIKKKIGGHKVKVVASKAQHFQPPSEYTIDVSDVKIGWHYDKTTGEIVYDLLLMDGDKKYFMKPKSQSVPVAPEEQPSEPETTEAPKVPDVPADVPPTEEPPGEENPPDAPSADTEPAPDQPPTPPAGGPDVPTPDADPQSELPPDDEPELPAKKKPVQPGVRESSLVNDESYSVEEILNDIRSVIEEVTGRSNLKPYIIGAGRKKGKLIQFEIEIPKTHLLENYSSHDIELAFNVNDMEARVSDVYRGTKYNVNVKKYE